MRRRAGLVAALSLVVAVAACGSDDAGDPDDTGDTLAEQSATTDAAIAGDEGTDGDDGTDGDEGAADESPSADTDAAPAGGGTATLTLANGETFEFDGLLCALEPQMSAGSEILFNAVSYADPGLDVTQFGDEGTITSVASISVYDADFETLWEANSMSGSSVELTLDGTTIRGSGAFLPGGELTGEPVDGELVANC